MIGKCLQFSDVFVLQNKLRGHEHYIRRSWSFWHKLIISGFLRGFFASSILKVYYIHFKAFMGCPFQHGLLHSCTCTALSCTSTALLSEKYGRRMTCEQQGRKTLEMGLKLATPCKASHIRSIENHVVQLCMIIPLAARDHPIG